MQFVIKGAAIIALCIVFAAADYCRRHGIRSVRDFHQFRAMMLEADGDPLISALMDRRLVEGSDAAELLRIEAPIQAEDYGRVVIYSAGGQGTVWAVDGRLASAHVSSCLWQWTFFDNVPDELKDAVGSVVALQEATESMPPHVADAIAPVLQRHLDVLDGVQIGGGLASGWPCSALKRSLPR